MILDITAEQLAECCKIVYGPSKYEHAPAQLFFDHAWGQSTFLRCSFPEEFTAKALEQLEELRAVLKAIHGLDADVVLCVYWSRIDPDALARHALSLGSR